MHLRRTHYAAIATLASAFTAPASAQHQHAAQATRDSPASPLDVPMGREGSGTAWQPDASPMYALHGMAGGWQLMLHGAVFLQYLDAGSDRAGETIGDRAQFGATNWFMGMARHELGGGEVMFRAMFSLDPLTIGECGYPDLLATGESCDGEPLHDRQHPHDLFMEVAAEFRTAISDGVAVSLYGGPVAEPALGPVAFPHRLSAMPDPLAPIGHHWQDATHIAFGVVTAGVYGRSWKLEASLFNGREPDDNRYDVDMGALDSWSGRVWWLPGENLALQASLGRLTEAELDAHDGSRVDVTRATASLTYTRPVRAGGSWSSTLVWGRNDAHGRATNSLLAEAALALDGSNLFFGRVEGVEKSSEDLALADPALADRGFTVGKLSLGYTRQFGAGGFLPGLGAQISVGLVPDDLEPVYGARSPVGFSLYATLRPRATSTAHAHPAAPAQPGTPSRAGSLRPYAAR